MKNLLTIIKYTIKEAVTKKTFIIVNIIMFFIIIGLANVPNIINAFSNEDSSSDSVVYVLDSNKILVSESTTVKDEQNHFSLEFLTDYSMDDINQKIKNDEITSAINLKQENGVISFEYIVKEDSMYDDNTSIADNLAVMLKNVEINNQLKSINAPQEVIANVNTPISYEIVALEEDEGNNNFGIAMISAFILFFAVYFYGYSVSTSISSEKTSRVMETLITSTTPTKIVIGKTIAMGIVGLSQLVAMLLVAFASYKAFVPDNFDVLNSLIANLNITPVAIIICLVYFVLGYTVYAFLSAVTGATVSKAEDVQSASTPISLISLISFYLAYFTATVPNSSASKFASIFPFSAAFSMPGRILAGGVSGGEIAISIIVLALTAALLAFISIRVYSIAVLHYGNRLKLSNLFKMYKDK